MTRRKGLDAQDVAAAVRECRERAHLRQEDLATRLGVGRSAVMRWEGAQHLPDEENARKLALYFDQPLERFFMPPAEWERTLREKVTQLETDMAQIRAGVAELTRLVRRRDPP